MPIKIYPALADVPAASQSTAIETKDGQFAVEEVDTALGDAGKKALDDERKARKAESDARKAAEKERDELKRAADARDKGISADELEKIRVAEAAARKPIEDELVAIKAENRKLKLTDRVRLLALDKGVMKDRIGKVMRDLDGRLDLADDGATIVVKDEAGNVTSESVDDFLGTTYRKEASFYYEGTGASGAGSSGSSGASGGGFDAVAAGKAAAAVQKSGREQNKLAFT